MKHGENKSLKNRNSLKGLLLSTATIVGLLGVIYNAQGQGLSLEGLVDSKGKFGAQGNLMIPVGGSLVSGMPFVNVGGGLLGESKNGSIGGGYGIGYEDWGIRGYASFDVQEGKRHHIFLGTTVGTEVIYRGFGIRVNGYAPIGDRSHKVNNGGTRGVLVDKEPQPGSCDPTSGCIPPIPPNSCSNQTGPRICDIAIELTRPSYEKAYAGFDVGVNYRLPLTGTTDIVLTGEYYRFGQNKITGVRAGVEASIPLTSQLSLNVGVKGVKGFNGDDKKLGGYASMGISYQFGGTSLQQSNYIARRFNQAPIRHTNGMTTQIEKGTSTIYRNSQTGSGIKAPMVGAIWNENSRGQYISEIWFIDARFANQLDDIVAKAADSAIVVVDGGMGDVAPDDVVIFKNPSVGVVGAGSTLYAKATFDGGKTFFDTNVTLPGTRPTIVKTDQSKNIFYGYNVENPILYGLDIKGGNHGIVLANFSSARITDIHASLSYNSNIFLLDGDRSGSGYSIIKSTTAESSIIGSGIEVRDTIRLGLKDINTKENAVAGVLIRNSHGVSLDGFISERNKSWELIVDSSDSMVVKNFQILHSFDATRDNGGIFVINSENPLITQGRINNQGTKGIKILRSNNVILDSIYFQTTSSTPIGNAAIEVRDSKKIWVAHMDIAASYESGIFFYNSDNILLYGNSINLKGLANSIGITVLNSTGSRMNLMFEENQVANAVNGYVFNSDIFITDRGNNTASHVNQVCDGVADAIGSVKVLNLDTGLTESCQ